MNRAYEFLGMAESALKQRKPDVDKALLMLRLVTGEVQELQRALELVTGPGPVVIVGGPAVGRSVALAGDDGPDALRVGECGALVGTVA